MRDSSHAMTRSTLQRSVISMPNSRSAPSANATLLPERVEVVLAVGPRDDLVVLAVLADLLEAAVQIADVRDAAHDRLAVELEHQAQHAVRRRVLRPDVDEHVLAVELRLERGRRLQRDGRCRSRPSTSGVRCGRPCASSPVVDERDFDRALRRRHRYSPVLLARRAGADACRQADPRTHRRSRALPSSSALPDSRRAPDAAARRG